MNDFTKEELRWLYETIDNILEIFSEPDIGYSARDKLKLMIENYDNKAAGEKVVSRYSNASDYLKDR